MNSKNDAGKRKSTVSTAKQERVGLARLILALGLTEAEAEKAKALTSAESRSGGRRKSS
jgi:hypothetical protein